MEKFFKLKERGTTLRIECVAGMTTFFSMVYILMVNATMFADPFGDGSNPLGVSYGAIYIATAISAIVGTTLSGIISNLPLAMASGMGLNAFFVYTVCIGFGLSYSNALVLILGEGLVFILLTVTGLRKKIFESLPDAVLDEMKEAYQLSLGAEYYFDKRSMVADVCTIGCNQIYDENFGWIRNGTCEPVLYITTEQELSEIQTLMLAFLSNVNEDHILNNKYEDGEKERVLYASNLIKQSSMYVVELPDFSLQDVENIIKQNIRDNNVRYVAFDYIMSSLKILEEIAGRSGGIKLREDNILFMMSRRLKDIANEYGVFVLSGTQLNGDWKESDTPDQNLLRGAKSIADSIDLGMHILPVTQKDVEALKPVLDSSTFEVPNAKLAVYKNRRGRYKSVYLWCKSDLGTCRINPMFCTDFSYELINMNDLKINVSEKGAF